VEQLVECLSSAMVVLTVGPQTCCIIQKLYVVPHNELYIFAFSMILALSEIISLTPGVITVFAHSNARIVGSNPTQGMDVCLRLFCVCVVLCVGSGLATG
jgi:hypothetical protein